jgi:hypothetical protein
VKRAPTRDHDKSIRQVRAWSRGDWKDAQACRRAGNAEDCAFLELMAAVQNYVAVKLNGVVGKI